ncbi:MAG: WecB/TagA/CpsF family glycosyltransferase [Candidatus Daviesbacteria bacterium]|nr:WecB/TagA/CpsF family glycosyltransferase [Candidatus Daviesbacteria bacterium]
MKKYILGVKIDDIKIDQALEMVHDWLGSKKKYYIVTPNPEIIMAAQKDLGYRKLLNDADLSIPDGVGLKLSGQVKNTFAGVDFMEELIKHLSDWGATIGLLGGKNGVADRAAKCLRTKYPGVNIIFVESGGEVDEGGNMLSDYRLPTTAEDSRQKTVDLLFVAFGPPKQEKWIAQNIDKLDVKVAMSVGGSFDYISGDIPRAPRIVRALGFEWLFRLIVQPWRIKRQLSLLKYVLLLMFK